MDLGLSGKTVVITGASKGIGLAAAELFLEEGAKVAICARSEEQLMEAVKLLSSKGEVLGIVADVSKANEMYQFAEKVFQHFGRIDCWVNNVGAPWKEEEKNTLKKKWSGPLAYVLSRLYMDVRQRFDI